jgi:putative membrane protein
MTVPVVRLIKAQLLSLGVIITVLVLLVVLGLAVGLQQISLLGLALPIALSLGPAVVGPIIRHFDFTVADSPDGLRLRHGLLETRAQTVPPGRVQAVRILEPLLWRSRGWCRVEVNIAGYGGEGQSQTSVLLPVAPREEAFALLKRVLPDVDVATVEVHGVPRSARWVDPFAWRFQAAGADERVFVARRGRLRREIDIVPHARLQSARLTQGPLQRRLGLATVHLDTTPGPVHPTAAHRGAAEARRLLDDEVDRARQARSTAPPERWMSLPEGPPPPTVAG